MSTAALQPAEARPASDHAGVFVSPALLLVFIWAMSLTTVSSLERLAPTSVGSLDFIALVKVGVRFGAICVMSAVLALNWAMHQRKAAMHRLLPLLLFCGWAALSVGWTPMRSVTLGQAASLGALLLLAMNIALLPAEERTLSRVLFHLAIVVTCYSGLVLLVAAIAPVASGLDREAGRGVFHPTNVAATAMLGILLLLGARLLWNWPWSKRLVWIGLPMHAIALLLAHNRLSIVVGGLITLTMCGLLMRRTTFWCLVMGTCIVLGGLLFLDPGFTLISEYVTGATTFMERGQESHEIGALSGRVEMWEAMWKSYHNAPLIGHGYFVTSSEGKLLVWDSIRNHTAHNIFLQALVTTGIIGLTLFAWGMIRLLKLLASGLLEAKPEARCLAILAAFLTAWYALWSTLNESILGPMQPESIVFFTITGLLIGSENHTNSSQQPTPATTR